MKLSHAVWGHPWRAGHGGKVWQNVVHWRREWQTASVFLPWEPHKQYEKNSMNSMEKLPSVFKSASFLSSYRKCKYHWITGMGRKPSKKQHLIVINLQYCCRKVVIIISLFFVGSRSFAWFVGYTGMTVSCPHPGRCPLKKVSCCAQKTYSEGPLHQE